MKKAAVKDFAIFTGKYFVGNTQHRYFPMDIAKFLRTPILKNICGRLLLSFARWTDLEK